MKRVRNGLLLTLLAFVAGGIVVACGGGDDGTGIQPPPPPPNGGNGDVDSATVAGVIDTLTARAPFLATVAPRSGNPGQQSAPDPDSAFAGIPRTNGNIEVEAKDALPNADSFSVRVPAGRRNLMIVIGRGTQVDSIHNGRVLVFARTTPGAQIVTEPLNMETTLEGAVFLRGNFGQFTLPRGLMNNPQIGLLHRLPDGPARDAVTDTARIRNLALAYTQAQETLLRTFRSTLFDEAFDSTALNAGLRANAGQPYADARAGGTDHQAAHEQFIQDAVQVYADTIGNPMSLSVAWGAFGTKHDQRMAVPLDDDGNPLPEDPARLLMAQNILAITTEVRRTILEGLSDSAAKTAVSNALTSILDAGMAASDMAAFKTDVMSARTDGLADLEAEVGDLDESAANLGAFINAIDGTGDASNSPAEIALELPTFMNDLQNAVTNETYRALLLALMAGPGYQ